MLHRQSAADLLQGQVRLPGHQIEHRPAMLPQPRAMVTAHGASLGMTFGPPPLRQKSDGSVGPLDDLDLPLTVSG